MDKVSFSNPVFAAYALAASLMILKTVMMAWWTVLRMMQEKGGYRAPEDLKQTLLNRNPRPEQLLSNERVERIRRIHHNDLENIPVFLVAGLLYVWTAPPVLLAQVLFATYVVSRLLHLTAYATARTHDTRATLWTIGVLILMYMAGDVGWVALRSTL